MKFLVTGGLGNVGVSVIDKINSRGHEAIVFDIKNRKNKKRARKLKNKSNKIVFGDICNYDNLADLVPDCDCIIHMAAVVPPLSEKNKNLCHSVNINGTKNLINANNDKKYIKPIVYVSSSSVMGPTQSKNTPVITSMEPNPVSIYSKSKLEAEILISNSKARYCILRLASVLDSGSDYSDDLLQLLFDFPLEARNELILDMDAATAIVTAGELLIKGNSIDNRTFFIGGGRKNGFQIINNYFIRKMFGAMGIGMLSEECFTKDLSNYAMDWYDTSESNDLLNYQNHSFNDYIKILEKRTLSGGPVIKYMAPRLKKSMEMQSPYYNKQNGGE